MKKILVVLSTMCLLVFFISWSANATLYTIGTADIYYLDDCALIYDSDQSLVWLDYTYTNNNNWWGMGTKMSNIGSYGVLNAITVTLNPGVSTTIDWTTGWRLPVAGTTPSPLMGEGDSVQDTYSEMGYLYYQALGNTYKGSGSFNYGPFSNLIRNIYWLGTSHSGSRAYVHNFNYGSLENNPMTDYYFGIAVHPGSVSGVPIPGALWLFGSGLIGIVGIRRKFKN